MPFANPSLLLPSPQQGRVGRDETSREVDEQRVLVDVEHGADEALENGERLGEARRERVGRGMGGDRRPRGCCRNGSPPSAAPAPSVIPASTAPAARSTGGGRTAGRRRMRRD